jgi:hypothetical protein
MDVPEALVGVALRLQVEAKADLLVEIRPDENNAPGAQVVASQSLSVAPSSDGGAQWHFVELPAPVDLESGRRYWCALKASTGLVGWVLDPASPLVGLLRFDRDGAGWRVLPGPGASLPAQLRLLRAPSLDESPDPFSIEVSGASTPPEIVLTDKSLVVEFSTPADATSGLELTPTGGQVSIELKINAHARGNLVLSRIEAQYQPL